MSANNDREQLSALELWASGLTPDDVTRNSSTAKEIILIKSLLQTLDRRFHAQVKEEAEHIIALQQEIVELKAEIKRIDDYMLTRFMTLVGEINAADDDIRQELHEKNNRTIGLWEREQDNGII